MTTTTDELGNLCSSCGARTKTKRQKQCARCYTSSPKYQASGRAQTAPPRLEPQTTDTPVPAERKPTSPYRCRVHEAIVVRRNSRGFAVGCPLCATDRKRKPSPTDPLDTMTEGIWE